MAKRSSSEGDPLSVAERAAVQRSAQRLADDPEFWARAEKFLDQVAAGEVQTEPLDTKALRQRLKAQRKAG